MEFKALIQPVTWPHPFFVSNASTSVIIYDNKNYLNEHLVNIHI